jgi:hypothetical protein
MMSRRSTALFVTTISLSVLLVGCSASEATPKAQPKDVQTPSSIQTPSETPSVAPSTTDLDAAATIDDPIALAGAWEVTDTDGYTMRLNLTDKIWLEEDKSTQKPGFTSAAWQTSGGFAVENTTDGRELTFPSSPGMTVPEGYAQFWIAAFYDASSPVCTLRWPGGHPCYAVINDARLNADSIGVGESQRLDFILGMPGGAPTLDQIPEAEYDTYATAFAEPQGWGIVYTAYEGNSRFTTLCSSYEGAGAVPIVQISGDICNGGSTDRYPVASQLD